VGTGTSWDAATLQVVAALPGPVDDAAWIGDELHTLRSDGADATLVERFASDLVPGDPFGSWSGTAETPS